MNILSDTTQVSPQLPTSFINLWLGINPLTIEGSDNRTNEGLLHHNENEHVFDDEFQCELFIRSVQLGVKLILIVSEQLANDIVLSVHHLSQIKAVFICQEINITESQTS